MNHRKQHYTITFSVIALLVLILDSKTAIISAGEGITVCLKTVIPSLFPFVFLSSMLNTSLLGQSCRLFKPLASLCRIPIGSEILFLIGILGGYPLGAKSIYEAYQSRAITKEEAERMLGFCNNPGPAFLFGICGSLFDSALVPAILYVIIILSAILTGILIPGGAFRQCTLSKKTSENPLINAIRAMATVCAWVILFRILLTFLDQWLLWMLPKTLSVLLSGILEVTNGTLMLHDFENSGIKFLILTAIMSFGGLCIGMQTITVIGNLSCKTYFYGKVLQCLIAVSLAMITAAILFPGNIPFIYCILIAAPIIIVSLIGRIKNNTGNYCAHSV